MILSFFTYFEFFAFWSFFRGVVMVIGQWVVAYDVVVDQTVSFGSEVPWFLLGVVWPVFQTLQLILKVDHVECLLVAQCIILILRQHLNKIIFFGLLGDRFNFLVGVNLSYRIVSRLLLFYGFACNFFVNRCHSLKLFFLSYVPIDFLFPVVVIRFFGKKHLIRSRLSYFLILRWEKCHNFWNYNFLA